MVKTNRVLRFFFFLAFLASVSLNLFFYRQRQSENIVTEVVDGDTFQLKSGQRVRLMGVDAPEYDRCGGQEAKERLRQLIQGKQVKLSEVIPEAYGRSLALVFVGKTLVNKIIMEEGWGRADYRKNSHRDELTAAFHSAQTKKLGIFSDLCREEFKTPSGNCLIKGNIDKNSYEKFYHLPNCSHYDQIVIEKDIGEGYFCSEGEEIANGFKKAAGCP